MRMRWSRVSARKRLTRAARAAALAAGVSSGRPSAGSRPTRRISSVSMVISGGPSNQSSGRRPANQPRTSSGSASGRAAAWWCPFMVYMITPLQVLWEGELCDPGHICVGRRYRALVKELVYHRQLLPALDRNATRVGFHDGDYHGTWEQHGDRVLRLANALGTELGISQGDRVAILALNSHDYLELYHACYLGAGVVNPLNLRLAAKELAFILNDSGTEVVFTDFLFSGLLEQARPELKHLRSVVLMGEGDVPHDVKYEDLIGAGKPVVPEEPEETDPVVLMYTGGTTGLPKGVVLSQRAEMLNLYHVAVAVGLGEDRIYLHQTPMFHAASMAAVLGVPALGGQSVFIPLFEPGQVIDLIEEHKVNQTTMVPTMIAMVLHHPDFKPERLQTLDYLTYGASPMPGALLERLIDLFPDLEITQGYGMTE